MRLPLVLLKRRVPAKPKMGNSAVPQDSFKVLFSSEESSEPSRPSSGTLQQTDIRIVEVNEYLYEQEVFAQSPQPTSVPFTILKRGPSLRFRSPKPVKSVKFAEPQPKLVTKPERRDLKEILDLCTAIETYFPGAQALDSYTTKEEAS